MLRVSWGLWVYARDVTAYADPSEGMPEYADPNLCAARDYN